VLGQIKARLAARSSHTEDKTSVFGGLSGPGARPAGNIADPSRCLGNSLLPMGNVARGPTRRSDGLRDRAGPGNAPRRNPGARACTSGRSGYRERWDQFTADPRPALKADRWEVAQP
jgi:hypothetical protein